jgi:hypothetical protein
VETVGGDAEEGGEGMVKRGEERVGGAGAIWTIERGNVSCFARAWFMCVCFLLLSCQVDNTVAPVLQYCRVRYVGH